jgi:hypothetical protein
MNETETWEDFMTSPVAGGLSIISAMSPEWEALRRLPKFGRLPGSENKLAEREEGACTVWKCLRK